jgi:O-antigen/teichoic acid export membrane protein
MGLLFPVYNLSDIWGSWLNGKQNFRILSFGRICIAYLPLMALLVLIAIGISELWIIVAISFVSLAGLNMYMWYLASRYRKNNLQNSEWIAYAKRSSFALSFGAILTLEPVLLQQYYGAAEVAVYAIALLLPDQVKVFFGLINQACAARIHRHVRLKILLKDLRFIFATLCIASILVALIGFFKFQDIIIFLFSNKYSEAGHIGKWLWLFALMTAPINTFLGFIIQSRQHIFSTYIGGIGYPFLLIIFILLFIDMGVIGLIIARILLYILTSIFHCITILWLLRREINEENCLQS